LPAGLILLISSTEEINKMDLSLSFGSTSISDNQIIAPNQANLPLTFDFSNDKSKITVLLINTNTDTLYYLKDGQNELYSYLTLIPGNYLFLLYNSTNLTINVSSREAFKQSHQAKEFGTLIGKKRFIVQENLKTAFETLPVELNRLIAQGLPLNELQKYCDITPTLNKQVCNSRAFYELLAKTRLTNDSAVIASMTNEDIMKIIMQSEFLFGMYPSRWWYHQDENKSIKLAYLNKYDILRAKALKTLDLKYKLELLDDVARKGITSLLLPIYLSIPVELRAYLYISPYSTIFELLQTDPNINKQDIEQLVITQASDMINSSFKNKYIAVVEQRFPHLLPQVQQIVNARTNAQRINIRIEPNPNLDELNEATVERFYSRYGRVTDVRLNGVDRFMIQFEDPRDAQDAKNETNGVELEGYRIIVEN
jgi:hypothetical protein